MVSPIGRACPKIGYSVAFSILNSYALIFRYLIICVYMYIKDGCIKVARYETLRTKYLVNYTCTLLSIKTHFSRARYVTVNTHAINM